MNKLKWCVLACIWSFLMTGCSALWTKNPQVIDEESTKIYEEKSQEVQEQSVAQNNVQKLEAVLQENREDELTVSGEVLELPIGSQESIPEEVGQDGYAYFDDALFIGDSRTVGLREYGVFENSDFFATPGLSIYAVPRTKVTVHELEDVTLEELLAQKDYGKIYLMLGMNELGYDFEQTVERYRTFVEDLQTKEPEAKLYLCANMHVTIVRTENDDIFNNPNINKMNEEIRKLAEEKELPYLDINVLFDDENGNLAEEYTSDDSHVLGKYYEDWCQWLVENINE